MTLDHRPDDRFGQLSPELRERLECRAMVGLFSMAIALAPEAAIAHHRTLLNEYSRDESLALHEVTYLRSTAESWSEEFTEGWSAGFAEGRATAVLRILQSRGVHLTGTDWERASRTAPTWRRSPTGCDWPPPSRTPGICSPHSPLRSRGHGSAPAPALGCPV
ncbi:hypothetical protein [Streptomyces sp. NPDC005423]|uniref:hypothetical protein n=1 Tax=Streptomyces sp. NPDC005423 TaxID=3155343 RepID=UPI0033AA05E0